MGLSLFLANCAIGPVYGLIFTSNTFPGEINASNSVPAIKKGESCQSSLLALVSWGSSSANK
nr:TRL-like family protein [Leptospira fainei]